MTAYVALLRGVSPTNAKMPEIQKAFEAAGFKDVQTVLSSGNVVFQGPAAAEATIERKAEAALQRRLGRSFLTFARPVETLRSLLASDPYGAFTLKSGSKRVVTFLRDRPKTAVPLPVELDGACILALRGREAYSAYVAGPRGPVFMTLLERTFGKDITTRTWETLVKLVQRGSAAPGGNS